MDLPVYCDQEPNSCRFTEKCFHNKSDVCQIIAFQITDTL